MKITSTSVAGVILIASQSTPVSAHGAFISPLGGGVNLFPQASYTIEVDAAHENSAHGMWSGLTEADRSRGGSTRSYGSASVYPSFLKKIQKSLLAADNFDDAIIRQVQTVRLTESSQRHTDCTMDGPNVARVLEKNSDEQVGLFFQNTNPDAYFETDDGDLCIPIVEGTFISFDGSMPHRSVVNSGSIDMIGPFDLSSTELISVWGLGFGTNPPPSPPPTMDSKSGKQSKGGGDVRNLIRVGGESEATEEEEEPERLSMER